MQQPVEGILISWQAIVALCAFVGLCSAGIGLYVRAALGDFLDKLDRRFVLCPICETRHSDCERRIQTLEQEMLRD
jgi:hypothetical protein